MTEQEEKELKEQRATYIKYLITAARNIKKHCYNTYCEDCSFFNYYKQRCELNDAPESWEV